MPLYFVFFVFFSFLVFAQDSSPPRTPNSNSPNSPNEVQKVFDEVAAQRQILGDISRTLKDLPVSEGLRNLESANAKSQESLQTISAISEVIRRLETLVENVPRKVAEAAGSGAGAEEEFRTDLTSQLNSLQKLVKNQQTSLDGLSTKLTSLSGQTEKLEQSTKNQKASAKQTELLEKILSNQQTITENQKKILASLDKSLAETARLYYGKLCNGTHEVIKFFSDAFSSKQGSAAHFQKSAGAVLTQLGASTSKALAQGQDLVLKAHGEIANYLKTQVGLTDPINIYAATALLTVPLSLLALLIVTFAFKILRILGAIVFYPCYCCFRRRSRPVVEDGESKKRKSPEDQTTAAKPVGKKGKTH